MENGAEFKKKRKVFGLACVGCLGAFNVIAFLACQNKSVTFWVSYVFVTAAIAVQIMRVLFGAKCDKVKTRLIGLPLGRFSICYSCAGLLAGVFFLIIIGQVPVMVVVAFQAVVFAFFMIVAVSTLVPYYKLVDKGGGSDGAACDFREIAAEVESMIDACQDPEMKKCLEELRNIIRSSDMDGNEAVRELDESIKAGVEELRMLLEKGKLPEGEKKCGDIELLVLKRRQKLKMV